MRFCIWRTIVFLLCRGGIEVRKQITRLNKIGKGILSIGLIFTLLTPYSVFAQEVTPSDGEKQGGDEEVSLYSDDVTSPVIEEIIFPDNGKSMRAGEHLPIYVTAYDTGDGIESMYGYVYYIKENNESTSKYIDFTYNETEKRYEGSIPAIDGGYINAKITQIKAVDFMGNFVDGKVKDDEYNPLYTFEIIGGTESDLSFEIENFEFKENGTEIDRESSIHVSLTLPQETSEQFDFVNIRFDKENHGHIHTLYKVEGTNRYEGTLDISGYASGKWFLSDISAGQNKCNLLNMDTYFFTVNGETEAPVIISIEQDHIGDILQATDKVTLKVRATDNTAVNKEYATAQYHSTAQTVNNYRTIYLEYDETSDLFIGTFEIKDITYPCEWYLSNVTIKDTSGNETKLSKQGLNQNYPYYFYVKTGDAFINPTYTFNASFKVLNDKGNYTEVSHVEKEKVERRSTFKDAGIAFPDGSTTYKGLKFMGWVDQNGNKVNEETLVLNDVNYMSYYAVYDKIVLNMNKTYVDTDQQIQYTSDKVLMPHGTTYRDALKIAEESTPSDMYAPNLFQGWKCELYNNKTLDDEVDSLQNSYVSFQAIYKDKKVVTVGRRFYGTDGRIKVDQITKLVDDGTTYEKLEEEIILKEMPKIFEGLRFEEWDFRNENTGVIKNNYEYVMGEGAYENCIVRVLLDDMFKGDFGWAGYGEPHWTYVKATTAEIGDTITIPETPEYKNITWRSFRNGSTYGRGEEITKNKTFIVKGNMEFDGYGDEVNGEVKPVDPIEPEKPVNPIAPEEPSGDNIIKEDIHLSNDMIQSIVNDIQSTQEGGEVNIVMGEAKIIPVDILQAAKGKDIDVKVVMNGYTWTINGKNIIADNLKDINLEVTLNADAVPSSVVKKLAGDLPTKQLSLTHNGDFGFTADLSFNLGDTYAGKYGNLYYYDSDGKMVFMNAGKINEQGDVTVSFSHASDYVIVINDVVMSNEDAIKETAQDTASTSGSMVLIGICVLFAYGYFTSKKQGKA